MLPDVRARSGLGDGALGIALGAVAVAALPAMPLAGRLADRHGARRLLPASLLAFAAVAALLGAAARPPLLLVGLVALGACTGVLDVVANSSTAAWERATGGRLMGAAHGLFSLGVLAASAGTGLARELGAGPAQVLAAVGLLVAAAAAAQPAYRRVPVPPPAARVRRRPAPVLLGLGAVVGCAFLVEDGVQSWSALHLERTLGAPPSLSGLGPGLFAAAMAAGRLVQHRLVPAGREGRALAAGGALAGAGLLLLGLAPSPGPALVGAAVTGAGASVLAPTLLSAVGARSGPGRQGADLALVSVLGYAGFVVGPVLVGLLSAALSLPAALALLAALAAGCALGGPALLRVPSGQASAPADGAGHP